MKDHDTAIGGASPAFPLTRHSIVQALGAGDPTQRERAWETIVHGYWKPAYKHLRIRWGKSNEDAKDLTQAFFARAIEKDFFASFDESKSRFRTFLRTCLDGFVANETKSANAIKRGGGTLIDRLDFDRAEDELAQRPNAKAVSTDDVFDREWLRSLVAAAVDGLRAAAASVAQRQAFEMFLACDMASAHAESRPSYGDLAQRFGVDTVTVTNRLSAARRDFRACLMARIRAVTANDDEFRAEVRTVLGFDPP